MQGMEEDFRFLLCEKCHQELQSPKLLACLHTLCSNCVTESKPICNCPVCGVSAPRFQDNLLFMHLQADLNTYQQIVAGEELLCSRCKEKAEYWCSECREFLCVKCYSAHQWYLKRKNHEAQKIGEVKVDSATSFLEGARNSCTLFCSTPAHCNQGHISSLYCRQCQKPLCCSCALLDSQHSKFYCDISVEIQERKEELKRMSEELREKEECYEQTYSNIQQRVQQMEKVRNDTRDLIQENVEKMIQQIKQKGEQLIEEVDKQLQKEHQDTQAKLEAMKCMLSRMKTGKQLVEKMTAFASDQEVMDMHPFIKESLEELKREKVPTEGLRTRTRNFSEVKDELQALCMKVMGQKDAPSTSREPSSTQTPNTAVLCNDIHPPMAQGTLVPKYTISIEKRLYGYTPSITSPRKRHLNQCEKSIQASPKTLKHEDLQSEEGENSTGAVRDEVLCPPCAHEMTLERDQRVSISSADADHSRPEICESEDASIVISSSDDTDAETM